MTRSPSPDTPRRSDTHYALRIDPRDVPREAPRDLSTTGWALPPRSRVRPRQARIGDVLGSYRLVERIGSGGMGCVYRAEHVKLGRALALKLLHHQHAQRRDLVARLFQEARAASQIRHPNIVDVVDYLEIDHHTVCIVMEYLPGPSLGRLMEIPGSLAAPRALDILAQICDGLAAAHQAGIVHRDLKPDNVVVVSQKGQRDLVKIVDFGVAKLLDNDDSPLTAAGQVFGTPPYMSPEQAAGLAVDARTDIYSLGAIAYEMFTGYPPFKAANFSEYLFKHINVAPAPPTPAAGRPPIDPAIEAMILRCLDKEPAARYQSAGALERDIRSIRHRLLGGTVRTGPVPRAPTRSTVRTRPAPSGPVVRRTFWSLAVIIGAALVGGVVGIANRGETPAPAPHQTAARQAARSPTNRPTIARIISDPPGQVFRQGQSEPLCRTPCELAITPGSDRSARMVLVVRRKGYHEKAVAIDVGAPPSRLQVTLERERPRPAGERRDPDGTLNPYRDGIE